MVFCGVRLPTAHKAHAVGAGGIAREFGEQLTGAKPQAWHIFRGGVIRPVWTTGSGRYCKNCDHTADICAVLDALRVKYVTGNDAPRGGLTGNYIKIITKIIV